MYRASTALRAVIALLLCGASAAQSQAGGSFKVTVLDASTKTPLGLGLFCALYDEANAVVATSSDGCTLSVPPCTGAACAKHYHLTVSKASYYLQRKSGLRLNGYNTPVSVQLSSTLLFSAAVEQMRIVLSWGTAHNDLDSHLIVPPGAAGSPSCEVYWSQKTCRGPSAASTCTGPSPHGTACYHLDVDDTDFYGPETTTITNPHPGVYSYIVHIYGAGKKCWDTSGIAAKVDVWGSKKGGLIKSVAQPRENAAATCANAPAPAKTCHKYWHVFDFDATTNAFTWTNKMVPSKSAATLQASAMGRGAYLPQSSTCSCATHMGGDSASAVAWAAFTTRAANALATSLLGDGGVAGQATCHAKLQQFFGAAATDAAVKTAASVAASLGAKVAARFVARKATAMAMHKRAIDIYAGTHPAPTAAVPQPRCLLPCDACLFDSSFKGPVNKRGYGLRYGARAAPAGAPARAQDEKVAMGLGELLTAADDGTFATQPTTKWGYIGLESGANMIAPQTPGSAASCRAYDPRLRPWYAEAVSRAKNVVVVIDGSPAVSETQLLTLKAAAKAVLGTLAAGDTVNIVVGRSGGTTPSVPGDTAGTDLTYRSCTKLQMLRAVPVNKKLLSRYLDELGRESGSGTSAPWDAVAAVRSAQTLLNAQRVFKQANYAAISSEDVVVMLSSSSPAGAASVYTSLKGEISPPATWAVYTASDGAAYVDLPAGNGLRAAADWTTAFGHADAGFAPARYYAHASLRKTLSGAAAATPAAAFASAFYEDNSGLGLVTTIVAPVLHGGALRGVVGLDVTVLELVADLVFEREYSASYAFIVNAAGSAVWHPALPSPADALGVESVNIRDLEIDPLFATLVYPSLVAGNTSDATLTVSTPTARGDATFAGFATVQRQFKYAWQPIAGTPFRLCVALAQQDRAPKPLLSPPTACAGAADACDVYHDIAQGPLCGKTTDGARKGTVRGTAGAFYAASAFDRPAAWLEHRESAADAKLIAGATTCARAGTTPPDIFISKSVGSLKTAAINDNMVARQVDGCWSSAQAAESQYVWSFFGAANGLFRTMPAHVVKKRYEAAKRPWYLAAVANRDSSGAYGPTISLPYLDASGAGEVITISRAVTRGGTAATDPVAGVVGADLKLAEVQRIVNAQVPCGNANVRCMLIDDTAHLVYHQDFVATAAAEENVFLADKHRELADRLVTAGVLTQNTCMDYAAGYRKTSYKIDAAQLSGASGSLSCGFWSLARAGKTNMYLLAVSSNGCASAGATCAACSVANCKAAQWSTFAAKLLCQPCQCKVDYNSCALNYGQSSPKSVACPASPPPLFSDLCPNDGPGNDDGDVPGWFVPVVVIFPAIAVFLFCKFCCCKKKDHGKEVVTPAAVTAPPRQVTQYGQPAPQVAMVAVPMAQPVPQHAQGYGNHPNPAHPQVVMVAPPAYNM